MAAAVPPPDTILASTPAELALHPERSVAAGGCGSHCAQILPHRQAWAFAVGKFMTDPIWWLYLFWVPDFLNRNHGLNLLAVGPPLVAIYLIADVGSIGGGWLSSALIKRGWTVNAARKTAMFVCGCAVIPIVFASMANELWMAVLLVGARRRRASGLVGEHVHARERHVPAPGGRHGRRVRRHGRRVRRHADREADGIHSRNDRQLPARVPDRRVNVPDRRCSSFICWRRGWNAWKECDPGNGSL